MDNDFRDDLQNPTEADLNECYGSKYQPAADVGHKKIRTLEVASNERQHVLHRDYETRSTVSLKAVGAHRYAADPRTEVICVAYAVDHGPVQLCNPREPEPPEFVEAARNPSWIVAAHNDAFESAVEQYILRPRYNWSIIPSERHRCTMTMALAAGLPARLSAAADALELANRKDASGERLMHQMSKPPARIVLMIKNDSIDFAFIANKISKSSVNFIIDCRHCRPPNRHYGYSATRLILAAFV
jgi:hypothetical protein